MKLSIIVPAYNAENTISECLNSIFAQSFSDYEVIVIDDGSVDQTQKILRDYSEAFPERLRIKTVENGGQGRARNIGIEMSNGDYLGFVDSDDWIEPDMFEKLLSTAELTGSDLVHCEVLAHFPDGTTADEMIYRSACPMASAGFANNKLFRRDLIESVRFPEEKLWYEDTEFTARCIHRAKKITHLSESLYHYRRGLPSTMNNQNALKNLDILTVMQHLEDEFLPDSKHDFEFLLINHVLLDAINRVQAMSSPDKRDVIWLLRSYTHEKIPHLRQSKAFLEETRNRKIIMQLNYLGLDELSAKLLKMKSGRK